MASLTDKITDVRNGSRPGTATVTVARSIAGTVLSCNDLSGWPTDSKVHFVTYQIDTNNDPIPGTQLDCSGIVSGSTITQLTVHDGTDGGSSIGDIVEMLPTAMWAQDLADGLTESLTRTGALSATALGQIYPVGSIYTNAAVSTNPATLLGFGTWAAFGSGRVMVGVDAGQTEFDTLGETGGAKTHTLTTTEMPSHTHANRLRAFIPSGTGSLVINDRGGDAVLISDNASHGVNGENLSGDPSVGLAAGSDGAHNNLQPYVTVYMWRRTT